MLKSDLPTLPVRAQTSVAKRREIKSVDFGDQMAATTQFTSRVFISEKQRLAFGMMTHDSFGAFSPQWTIPSSRREPRKKDEVPGPGAYELLTEKDSKYHHIIENRPEADYSTITSNVEIMNERDLQKPKNRTIGPLDGFHYYSRMPKSPAPCYSPPVFDGIRPMTIGSKRRDERPSGVPGPGAYSPTQATAKKVPSYEFPRFMKREVWQDALDTPGPGSYETVKQPKKPKRWAGKLRVRTADMKARESCRDRPWAADNYC